MSSLRLTRLKFILVFLVILVFSNEWITFMVKTHSWQSLAVKKDDDSLRILIVADPQILSVISEPSFPFNYVAVWDANRFVSRSFHLSLVHTNPDVIIFLGDLINDGSISTNEEFQNLVKTFKSLFPIFLFCKDCTGTIRYSFEIVFYIPGDNDIGGERQDRVTSEKVLRFNQAFNVTNRMHHKFLSLIHVNVIPGAEKAIATHIPETEKSPSSDLNIIVSHLPLLPGAVEKTMHKIRDAKPNLIISAHDHDSYKFLGKKSDPKAYQFWVLRDEEKIWDFDLNSEELIEISAPTCSYRMGQKKYGFGLRSLIKKRWI
ncbi:Metallophosphoesterase 1 [Armadillidium nasatum]|uniref:Metallophosphoesterase 1 n=1 Tax=Armadillidium nasatum TaxID=96803 RepID=A0A5N5TDZ6_9CRUS|nr:Metallophosphoesterase 1 [Armadillidium nasatum]